MIEWTVDLLKPRDVIWVDIGGEHPAVVLDLDSGTRRAAIITGTKTAGRRYGCFTVEIEKQRESRRMGLRFTTHFYDTDIYRIDFSAVIRRQGDCSEKVHQALTALAQAYLAQHWPEV